MSNIKWSNKNRQKWVNVHVNSEHVVKHTIVTLVNASSYNELGIVM